jgi:hypothetical protein
MFFRPVVGVVEVSVDVVEELNGVIVQILKFWTPPVTAGSTFAPWELIDSTEL